MKKVVLAALIVGLVGLVVHRVWAQDDPRRAPGTVFITAQDGGRNVTISRHGTVLAAFNLPKGTILSARDDVHAVPQHMGGGRFEFHGNFELRAMTPNDVPPEAQRDGMAAALLLRQAPMVLAAQDVDVVIER
ncbi:MAG TPA: hypothetical protein VH417_05145 [Vicinamibacterales bacterium]|jgi:hypothetical protein